MGDPAGTALRLTATAGGALAVLSGLLLLLWPGKTLLVIAALLGAWLIVIGIVRIVQAIVTRAHTWRARVLTGAAGLLYVVIGAVCLRNLFTSLRLLAAIIGLVWIVGGVAEIAWRKRSSVVLGLLSIAAGLAVLLVPELSLTVMAAVAGAWLILVGVLMMLGVMLGGTFDPHKNATVVPE